VFVNSSKTSEVLEGTGTYEFLQLGMMIFGFHILLKRDLADRVPLMTQLRPEILAIKTCSAKPIPQ
jgi:hypothetical protein